MIAASLEKNKSPDDSQRGEKECAEEKRAESIMWLPSHMLHNQSMDIPSEVFLEEMDI